jgi:sugar O-acyltransferase (sialic acid O-acetyltransferase NeuD family)
MLRSHRRIQSPFWFNMHNIVIVGAGGFGREVASFLWDCFSRDDYQLKGFLGKDETTPEGCVPGANLIGDPDTYQPCADDRFILAIGPMEVRRRIAEVLMNKAARFLTMVHPSTTVVDSATIGTGVILYPNSFVSNTAVLDDYAHLSLFASVGHDGYVGKFSMLSPYSTLNGFASVANDVFVGSHATIGPGTVVGEHCVISANSSVLRDIPPNRFVFGVPARQTAKFASP